MRIGQRAARLLLAAGATTLLFAALRGQEEPSGEPLELPARLTAEGAPAAVLRVDVRDPDGTLLPSRLSFVGPEGPQAELFTNVEARPDELAVRKNTLNTLTGTAAITIPPGLYEVWASHGLEWSVERTSLKLEAGREYAWSAVLTHEVDTTGWISGDYHLHTLTHSGHGDSNMKERIITLVAEGVEFAVATDHNHNTDYDPTIGELGVTDRLSAVVGNEVSTPIGHLNAFPLDASRPVVDSRLRSASELFSLIRDEPNPFGVVPVIQLNHPRWLGIDFFTQTGLDPVTADSDSPAYSADWDTLEVFNANDGWGYHDADTTELDVQAGIHSVLGDWFHLLNQGHRYAAVGNSDSHTVHYEFAGWPRNYTPSAGDDPADIDVAGLATALRSGNVFTTLGPFVETTVAGAPMGSLVPLGERGAIELTIRVQAASWIDCDRVKVVIDGDVVDVIEVPAERTPLRLETTRAYAFERDGWISVLVEGDDPLEPVLVGPHRPIVPLAVSNPIRVDADGDGHWTSLREWAEAEAARERPALALPIFARSQKRPEPRAELVLAAWRAGHPEAARAAQFCLEDVDRRVLLAAARAAEGLGDRSLLRPLEIQWERAGDTYLRLTLWRALAACGDPRANERLLELLGDPKLGRYDHELEGRVPGTPVRAWQVLGYFPNPTPETVIETAYAPESEPERTEFDGRDGPIAWSDARADESGYLDLSTIDSARSDGSIAYARTWLHSDEAREVAWMLGTDDGARVWIGGERVHEDASRHGASPMQAHGRVPLAAGWTPVLFKVENVGGGFGLYFRILDDRVTSAAAPR